MIRLARLLLPVLCLALPLHAAVDEDDLLPVEEAFALTAEVDVDSTLRLHWQIADGYYLYRHRLALKALDGGVEAGDLALPAGKAYRDEFFGDVETYRGRLEASAKLRWPPGLEAAEFELRYQGCADVGVCYPPQKQVLRLALPASGVAPAAGRLRASGEPATSETLDSRLRGNDGDAAATPADNPLARLLGGEPAPAPLQDDAPAEREPPLPPEQAFVFEAIAFSPTQVLARFTMPKGYYLYRDNTSFALESTGLRMGAPQWPQAQPHIDDHFGEVFVYFDQVEVPIDVAAPQPGVATPLNLTADFQGCQLDGICYPPMTRTVALALPPATAEQIATVAPAVSLAKAAAAQRAAPGHDGGDDDALSRVIAGGGSWMLAAFFAAGLLLAFTPCVLPMVPILSGLIAGAGTISTRRAFVLSLVYVLASALVFTLAGVVAGLAGQNLQALFQKPWILISFAALFVLLAFSMFGFYELQLPARWQTRLAQVSNKQRGGSLIGVGVMGMLSALIVGPCVAPPLAAAVAYIGRTGDPVLGGSALFALALGMGAPLLVIGTGAGRWLPRAGAWMDTVKAVFGVAFLFLAWWMLERILPPAWTLGLLGALLIGCGVYVGALTRLPDTAGGWRKLWQALGLVLIVLGAAQLVGALSGARDYLRPLANLGSGAVAVADARTFRIVRSEAELDAALSEAAAHDRVVLFDFYADWCVECKRMERHTFPEPPVQQALADVVMLKIDVTAQNTDDVALQQRFGIVGPPATLFFRDGHELRPLRLVGYENAAAFAARIARAKDSGA